LIKMFHLVASKHAQYYYDHVDVKLAICRFIAEYLLRCKQAGLKINLDHTLEAYRAELHFDASII
jgi:hypothetical protein